MEIRSITLRTSSSKPTKLRLIPRRCLILLSIKPLLYYCPFKAKDNSGKTVRSRKFLHAQRVKKTNIRPEDVSSRMNSLRRMSAARIMDNMFNKCTSTCEGLSPPCKVMTTKFSRQVQRPGEGAPNTTREISGARRSEVYPRIK